MVTDRKPVGNSSDREDHPFAGCEPAVRKIYDELRKAARRLGSFDVDPRKTSVHFSNGNAFCAIQLRKDAIMVVLRTESPIESPRVIRSEQVMANRIDNEVRITSAKELDSEFCRWLRKAYELGK